MRALGSLLCAATAWAARVVDVAVDGDGAMQTDDGGPLSSWAITEYECSPASGRTSLPRTAAVVSCLSST